MKSIVATDTGYKLDKQHGRHKPGKLCVYIDSSNLKKALKGSYQMLTTEKNIVVLAKTKIFTILLLHLGH